MSSSLGSFLSRGMIDNSATTVLYTALGVGLTQAVRENLLVAIYGAPALAWDSTAVRYFRVHFPPGFRLRLSIPIRELIGENVRLERMTQEEVSLMYAQQHLLTMVESL